MTGRIRRIGVAIPARDEEASIGACLRSVRAAAADLGIPVDVVVVADACRDRTAAIAAGITGVEVLVLEAADVGAARAAGCARLLALGADWIACTDADSVVPANWLSLQLRLAAAGADVVVGTVSPDFLELSPAQRSAWTARREPGRPNGHVHGANLGIRAESYVAAGGFVPAPEHEDVDLVTRLRPLATIVASDEADVLTSGRQVGRTPGGYARYLREDLVAGESRKITI